MEMLETIGIFFAQTFIIVLAIIAILLTLASLALKNRHKDSFEIELLHERFEDQTQALKESFLTDQEIKKEHKRLKKEAKQKQKEDSDKKQRRIFVVHFLTGDIKASDSENLKEEINTILGVATKDDEVVVKVESPGGLVHSYGYAAAQLIRVRDAGIPLTVCVDQVAASGGYLMACVGSKVIAAPFALIGSIGVVAQVPNFNRLLKKHDVDYKEYTAGDYKRTVSIFGEITEKGEAKFKEQLELTHQLFKSFVSRFRPQLDLNKVATGEFWYGETAISLGLIDEIKTSDEYLLTLSKDHHVVKISFEHKPTLMEKISEGISGAISKGISLAIRKLADQNTLVK
ncbi:MAG: protease SohB [Bdellovibrionales bacterium RIFCSPHIGHO2_01_FULL_40_29]|nr:MAG: protease SohB [Bdellovibrionales bacterium RIFCSPHIGHO2_01_FULL_40_29]OFZ34406.1 MAG: protease SohB [Bdellovibrionales bacterium RIFCSPHIGHO2_02_FULL_40_15]